MSAALTKVKLLVVVAALFGSDALLIARPSVARCDLNVHTFSSDFFDPAARRFAEAVADGRTSRALEAAQQAPNGVNTVGNHGATGLLMAVERRDKTMAKTLLNAQADPNGAPNYAPLPIAVKNTDPEMIRLLLSFNADPDKTMEGDTALSEAALISSLECAKILLDGGADVNKQDALGNTAALVAATTDHWAMVDFLLDHGASPWLDAKGMTVADFATDSRLLPDSVEGRAMAQVVSRLRASGYPWPPPSVKEVNARKAAGTWPPRQ